MHHIKLYLTPAAIFFGLALIAAAIFFSNSDFSRVAAKMMGDAETPSEKSGQRASTEAINPVTEADHIKGSLDAPVTIVEYSDFECPFCQRLHNTMNEIMASQGAQGDVAWVFRQFPIEQLHSKAPTVALASECAAKLGGNDAFWQFSDRYFDVSLSNNKTDIETVIPQLVTEIGLDKAAFQSCMDSGELLADVEEDGQNAVATGGRGTPWSIVIGPSGKTYPLSGAQPRAAVERLIQIAQDEA